MDLKCLIKLLIEKKYIDEYNCLEEDTLGTIAIEYKCKYKEVRSKIYQNIEDEHDEGCLLDIESQLRTVCGDNHITIVNIDKLEKYILMLSKGRENFTLKRAKDLNNMELFKSIFDDMESIEVELDIGNFYVTNNIVKRERIAKSKAEKEECLDFLSKLP